MQIIGTEIGQTIKKEMWPMIAVNTIKTVLAAHHIDYVFIDDLRFLFEYLCVYREFQHDCDVEPFFVIADEVVRAKRRELLLKSLKNRASTYQNVNQWKYCCRLCDYISLTILLKTIKSG